MNWTPESKILVQGIGNTRGSYYATRMKAYGTNIVAAIIAGKGGQLLDDIPVFDLVEQAIEELGEVQTTAIFARPESVLDAALEAIAAGIRQIVLVSRGVPSLDMISLLEKARSTNTLILGGGSAGIIIPEKVWIGTVEPQYYTLGKVGLISRSHSLSYEVAIALNQAGLGESIAINLGTDRIIGSSFEQWLQILEQDKDTEVIVLIEQPNGNISPESVEYIANNINKPVIVYIAGLEVPMPRDFTDALSIITTQISHSVPVTNRNQQIIAALKKARVSVAKRPSQVSQLVERALKKT